MSNISNIWLTSDTHFLHNKDFIYIARGFNSIEEMNAVIVEHWNTIIQPDDVVYHLGDVMMSTDIESGLRLVSQLNGRKYLAYGNHDSNRRIEAFRNSNLFEDIQMGYRIIYKKKILILSHYPQMVANGDDKTPIYSIHGHTHSKDKWSLLYHCYNVNMDAHNCTPINLEQINNDIREQRIAEFSTGLK